MVLCHNAKDKEVFSYARPFIRAITYALEVMLLYGMINKIKQK